VLVLGQVACVSVHIEEDRDPSRDDASTGEQAIDPNAADATPPSVPNEAGVADDARVLSSALKVPTTFDGACYTEWLMNHCPLNSGEASIPFRPWSTNRATCAAAPPFSDPASAAAGCKIVESEPTFDADDDGIRLSAIVWEGGVGCGRGSLVKCNGQTFSYSQTTWHDGIDLHVYSGLVTDEKAKCGYSAWDEPAQNALPQLEAHLPEALSTFCAVDSADDPIALARPVNSPAIADCPSAPPFTIPREALALGCTRTSVESLQRPITDSNGDRIQLDAVLSESGASCRLTEAFDCAGSVWTWQRVLGVRGIEVQLVRGPIAPSETVEPCCFASPAI
jgi:hypothetical protein